MTVRGPVDADARDALRQRLEDASLTVLAIEEPPEEETDTYGLVLSDYGRMIGTLYAEGYYGPTVSIRVDGREAAEIDPFDPPAEIGLVRIDVETGPLFTFGSTRVAPRAPGATAEPIVDGFAQGEPARSDLVGSAANAGVREWRFEGHPKVELGEQEIIADHRAQELDVDIRLAPGPQLRFGSIGIAGTSDISNRRVREIMGFPTGQTYSPDLLREAVSRLQRTGVWQTVSIIEAETPNPDGTLDYQVTLIERPPRRFGVSAELSTDEGLTVGGFWLHRNIFGGAERLRFDAEVANIGGSEVGFTGDDGTDTTLSFRLSRPGTFGPDNEAFFFGTFEDTRDPDFDETAFTIGIGLKRFFTPNLSGEVSGGLRYSDVTDDFGNREFYHIVFPSSLEWDRRDDPGDATEGFYLRVDATPFVGLDDSETGALGEVDARAYYGLGETDTRVLAGRVQFGSVVGSSLEGTPPEFLFFSGGGGSVRGQSFQSLGVTDSQGRDTGGRSYFGVQSEVRQQVAGSIGVVVFADAGYVGEESAITEDPGFHAGGGLGVRYATPIGPVRVDVGTPLTDDGGGRFSSAELYIGVGQAF